MSNGGIITIVKILETKVILLSVIRNKFFNYFKKNEKWPF